MRTTVDHVKRVRNDWSDTDLYAYIGRPSPFGNPIIIGEVCPICRKTHNTAGSTLGCYRKYFINKVSFDKCFRDSVLELKGKCLLCWCKPYNKCHGDIIAEYLNNLDSDDHILFTK